MDNTDNRYQRLELMIGKTYKHDGGMVKVIDVTVKGNVARLVTDGAPLYINIDNLDHELKAFRQIADNALMRNVCFIDSIQYENDICTVVQNRMLDIMDKLDTDVDEKFMARANIMNICVKNIIEAEKVKVTKFALAK